MFTKVQFLTSRCRAGMLAPNLLRRVGGEHGARFWSRTWQLWIGTMISHFVIALGIRNEQNNHKVMESIPMVLWSVLFLNLNYFHSVVYCFSPAFMVFSIHPPPPLKWNFLYAINFERMVAQCWKHCKESWICVALWFQASTRVLMYRVLQQ